MKLVFLAKAKSDLRWFKHYYLSVFPEGKAKADNQFLSIQKTLKINPYIGHPSEAVENAREYPVLKTPFIFLYRVQENSIEVLRIIDTRSDYQI